MTDPIDSQVAGPGSPAEYDLVISGGTVMDPSQGISRPATVAIRSGRIAGVLDPTTVISATEVIDATGLLVLPGLVDMHTHTFRGYGKSCDPDQHCLHRGATTVADAGTSGWAAFPALDEFVVQPSQVGMLAWLNISSIGMLDNDVGELQLLDHLNPERTAQMAQAHPNTIIGLKARSTESVCGGSFSPAFERLMVAAEMTQLPVMIHIGDSVETLPWILEKLRSGDVITHILTGRRNGVLDDKGKVHAAVLEARGRGVLFDGAHGRQSFNFPVARRALDQGFLPDSISTDVALVNTQDPDYGLPQYMTKLMGIGASLENLIPMVTSRPAAILGREGECGSLKPGMPADVTILVDEPADVTLADTQGNTLDVNRRLRLVHTIKAGKLI